MKIIQIGEIATSAINQIMGKDYITELNDSNIIDVGRDIINAERVDAVCRTLASQVGKIEIQSDVYKKRLKSLFIDSYEWGGFVERIYTDLESVSDSLMWSLTDGFDYSRYEHTYHNPKVTAKIFEEAKGIMVTFSRSTEQFKEAFRSMDELNKFATMLQQNIRNTINVALDSLSHALVSSAIAVSDKALNNSVHLVTEAISNGLLNEGATANDFLKSDNCLVYMCERIANVKGYIQGINRTFNNGNLATFCEEADVILLSDIKNAIKYRVRPHNYQDLVDITGEEVTAWQGITTAGTKYDFDTLSQIKISADASEKLGIGSSAVTINNAIALVKDRRSMGICLYKEQVTSSFTACASFWNEFTNILVNYLLDSNYSIVAFILD